MPLDCNLTYQLLASLKTVHLIWDAFYLQCSWSCHVQVMLKLHVIMRHTYLDVQLCKTKL